jgi:site-specific recombinase XerD
VARIWRENGLRWSTIAVYLQWVRRFQAHCARRGLAEETQLTRYGVVEFARAYARTRHIEPGEARRTAQIALRAWARGLETLGHPVPPWTSPVAGPTLPPLLREYVHYRQQHRGVAASSLRNEVQYLARFVAWLRTRRRPVARLTLPDVDAFIGVLRARMSRKSVAAVCSMLRAFLGFLHASGRLPADLATSVLAPVVRAGERPPRALSWVDVRRILRGIDRHCRRGRRDYALLLLMAAYGLGSAEARGLRLEDVDWRAGTIHIVRPKTGVPTVLPLLPAVGRALAAYLRGGRPRHTAARTVFVSARAPYGPLRGSSGVRHVLVKHARAAGVRAAFLGSHALRHSHACRQIEIGVRPKVLSDILGHRCPATTSAYVRIALARLRPLALPVP